MRQLHVKGSLLSGNPFANLLVIIAGVVVIGISILLSLFAFATLGVVILVTAAIVGLRVWWLNRRLGQSVKSGQRRGQRGRRPDVIEGEYRVVRPDRDEE